MNKETYDSEDMLLHLGTIVPLGFTMDNTGLFKKILSDRTIYIYLEIYESYPFDINFHGISLGIRLNQVEQIFADAYEAFPQKNDLHFGWGNDSETFERDFFGNIIGEPAQQLLYDTAVYNDETFAIVKPYLQQLIQAAVDFADQHSTLQSLYNYGETMTIDEQADFYSQPMPERKMIVKKLLNISDYTAYSDDLINFSINVEPDPLDAAFYQHLKNYLDTM